MPTDLVFIYDPGGVLLIPSVVAALVLDNLVDGKVLEACSPSNLFAMCRLADTRGACDNDVG